MKKNKINKDKVVYEYEYGTPPKSSPTKEKSRKEDTIKNCYYVEERRIFKEKQDVTSISVEDLIHFIKKDNVIFYTGAGLSVDADIFTMKQLMKALGISQNDILSKKNTIYNPKSTAQIYKTFCENMLYNKPTKAHEDLTKLAKHKQCKIVTENLDNLHQRTGIKPYSITGREFKQNIKNGWAKDIKAIICCGLSFDDKGFLGWYKKHNPNGIIIAIDLAIPNYLNQNNFFVQGNVQKIIPQI